MKRQAENVRSMVYQYGTVPARVAPVEGEELALSQMRLAQRLWNVLVTIERARVAGYRSIMRDEVQEQIDALRERKDATWQEIKATRQKARAKVATPGLDAEMMRIKTALRLLVEHKQSTKQQRHDARREQLNALAERANQRIKRARQAAASMGLFWGTYNAVIQSADAGRKHAGELRYQGFRGEGTVTAQVMGGATPEQCVAGGHPFFQVAPATPGQKWRYARVRIGSTSERQPLWVAIPVVYHREIPAEARIKSVSATRRILAGKVRWSLNVTVTLPPAEPRPAGQMVAIDIGWRLLPDGVRVAYWQDGTGNHSEVRIADSDIAQFRKISDLRSICDRAREEFLPSLVEWLKPYELDEEWTHRARALAQWRSNDRIAALIRWWADHRLSGDAEIYQTAVEWRRQYLHLANWWRNQQEQMTLRVREQYRRFAAGIASQFATVIVEDFDLRQVTETTEKAVGTYRQMVSPSLFRAAVINACKREGVEIRIVSGAYSTGACHNCQHIEVWDQAASILHRCGACGALWDQDHNAAINLLASGGVVLWRINLVAAIGPLSQDRSQTGGKEAVES